MGKKGEQVECDLCFKIVGGYEINRHQKTNTCKDRQDLIEKAKKNYQIEREKSNTECELCWKKLNKRNDIERHQKTKLCKERRELIERFIPKKQQKGGYIEEKPKGEYIEEKPKGEYIEEKPKGEYIEEKPKGEYIEEKPKGEYIEEKPKGEYIEEKPKGEYIEETDWREAKGEEVNVNINDGVNVEENEFYKNADNELKDYKGTISRLSVNDNKQRRGCILGGNVEEISEKELKIYNDAINNLDKLKNTIKVKDLRASESEAESTINEVNNMSESEVRNNEEGKSSKLRDIKTKLEEKMLRKILRRKNEVLTKQLQSLERKEEKLGSAFLMGKDGVVKETLDEVRDNLEQQNIKEKEIERLIYVFKINTLKQFKERSENYIKNFRRK